MPQGVLRMDEGASVSLAGGEAGSGGLAAKRCPLTGNFAAVRGAKPPPGGISTGD